MNALISDKILMPSTDIQTLAVDISLAIQNKQYDGYSGHNQQLASTIAFTLACMSTRYNWCVRASTDIDHDGFLYTVRIERQR